MTSPLKVSVTSLFIGRDLAEALWGDIEELYTERRRRYGIWNALRWYTVQVLGGIGSFLRLSKDQWRGNPEAIPAIRAARRLKRTIRSLSMVTPARIRTTSRMTPSKRAGLFGFAAVGLILLLLLGFAISTDTSVGRQIGIPVAMPLAAIRSLFDLFAFSIALLEAIHLARRERRLSRRKWALPTLIGLLGCICGLVAYSRVQHQRALSTAEHHISEVLQTNARTFDELTRALASDESFTSEALEKLIASGRVTVENVRLSGGSDKQYEVRLYRAIALDDGSKGRPQ